MPPVVLASSLAGAAAVMAWRIRETQRPVTLRKIVIPPLGMSTGLLMFLAPPARVPLSWAVLAFAIGALFLSYPLMKTSELTVEGDVVMLKRSPAFLFILVGLVAVRLVARSYVEDHVSTVQTGSLFFLLAFGMIVRWRVSMFLAYRALVGIGRPSR
ncbi:MAG TPA: cytochrome c biogenesis protein CcdC [Polyangiaceae bacterium]|nr:cytochrome c biogenesis protein CcdC [Polyangiaceae bacterium]